MIGNVPGVDRLLVHGWLRRLRDVGGGGAEQRHNETRECVVVLMTPVSGVLYRASAPDRRRSIGRSSRPEGQGSVVGIWSFAIWSLVRVFGPATESRQLSFAGPRPSGKVRSSAPQTDMVATTRQICRSPLVLSVGHAEWRKHPGVIGFPLPEDHGLW